MATTPRSIHPIPIVKELGENERDRSDSCSFLPSELDEREIRLPSMHLSLSLLLGLPPQVEGVLSCRTNQVAAQTRSLERCEDFKL